MQSSIEGDAQGSRKARWNDDTILDGVRCLRKAYRKRRRVGVGGFSVVSGHVRAWGGTERWREAYCAHDRH